MMTFNNLVLVFINNLVFVKAIVTRVIFNIKTKLIIIIA